MIELLTGHRPADSVESEYRGQMLDLIENHGDPFSRSRFDPGHFTVSALVLPPDGSSLLMIFHTKLGRWLQPGGHVEPSDADLQAAARREVVEETGLPDEAFEDGSGAALLTGETGSRETTFPVKAGPDLTQNGGVDAFVAKVTPGGTGLAFCGYLGGDRFDYGRAIAVDKSGKLCTTAWPANKPTNST